MPRLISLPLSLADLNACARSKIPMFMWVLRIQDSSHTSGMSCCRKSAARFGSKPKAKKVAAASSWYWRNSTGSLRVVIAW